MESAGVYLMRLTRGERLPMILTCPECGTRYVVKDGAIPPQGRQVRCASCKHSWHQEPESADPTDDTPDESVSEHGTVREFPAPEPLTHPAGEPGGKPAETRLSDHAHPDTPASAIDGSDDPDEHLLPEPGGSAPLSDPAVFESRDRIDTAHVPALSNEEPLPASAMSEEPAPYPAEAVPNDDTGRWSSARDEDYSPFAVQDDDAEPRRRGPLYLLLALLVIVAVAAAFWFLAPAELKQRVGVAQSGESPLLIQLQQQGRQELASGNQLLEVSGMVINPTNETQRVPPIRAQLRSLDQQVVYTWTIPPPARTLAPGGSASFNSAELNIPATAQCIDLSFGEPKPASQLPACKPGLGTSQEARSS